LLASEGFREIVLTGIHISSYGADLARGAPDEAGCRASPSPSAALAGVVELRGLIASIAGLAAESDSDGIDSIGSPSGSSSSISLASPDGPSAPSNPGGIGGPGNSSIRSGAAPPERGAMPPGERRLPQFRLRLSSIEPTAVTAALADTLSACRDVVCPHFHLSLQSGSAGVLKRMNRRYTPEAFRQSVALLRGAFPDAAITTDAIVGFPGETDEEFAESLAFCKEIGFSRIHVFKFSPRSGTPAASMAGQVGGEAKNARCRQLMDLAGGMSLAYHAMVVGKRLSVLVERVSEGAVEGLAPNYVRVRAAAAPGARVPPCGELAEIFVTAAGAEGLAGELVPSAGPPCGELAEALATAARAEGLAGELQP
jgi:tRNA A37 methylthiotransferase MiaB